MNDLSVVVPILEIPKDFEYLNSWLNTVLASELQVILVLSALDDKSEHNLQENFDRKNYTNLEIIRGKFENTGLARKAGFLKANTEWVSFWNIEDWPNPDVFKNMIQERARGANLLIGLHERTQQITPNSERVSENYWAQNNWYGVLKELSFGRLIFQRSTINHEMFGSYREGADEYFFVKYLSTDPYVDFFQQNCLEYDTGRRMNMRNQKIRSSDLLHVSQAILDETMRNSGELYFEVSVSVALKLLIEVIQFGWAKDKIIAAAKLVSFGFTNNPSKTIKRLVRLRKISRIKFPFTKPTKTYLVLAGGLGNQLFQMAYAINRNHKSEIATLFKSDRVSLNGTEISGLSNLSMEFQNGFDTRFKTRLIRKLLMSNLIEPRRYVTKLLRRSITTIYLRISISKKRLMSSTGEPGYFVDLNPPKSGEILLGYFQSYRWINNSVIKALNGLKPSNNQEILDEFRALAEVEKPLIVHLRIGDYKHNPQIGTIPADYFLTAISEIFDNKKHGKVWVFSDDLAIAQSLLDNEESTRYRFIGDLGNNPGLSLLVMSLGQEFIISNSTFSWWAAIWPTQHEKKVHYPDPWFDSLPTPPQLIPPTWIPRNRDSTNARR